MKQRLLLTLSLLFAIALLAVPMMAQEGGEGDMDGDGVNIGFPEVDEFDTESFVRFAHFAPNVGGVDIFVNDEIGDGLSGVEFGGLSEWMPVAPGGYDVDVAATGSSIDEAVLSVDSFELPRGQWTTVAVIEAEDGSPAVVTAVEDFTQPLPGVTNITFFNGLSSENDVTFLRDGVPFVINLGQLASEINSYSYAIPVDTDMYNFSANVDSTNTVLADETALDLNEWSSYLIAVYGDADGEAQLLIDETTRAESAQLRGRLLGDGTVVDALSGVEELQPYARLIDAAGLMEDLSGEGPFTIFIPAGFLADEILVAIDEDAIQNFLLGHVYQGEALYSQDLIERDSLETLSGNEIPVIVDDNGIFVGGAQVIDVNIPATNGVIHVIGYVIDPTLDQDDYDLFDDAVNLQAQADAETVGELEAMNEDMDDDEGEDTDSEESEDESGD